MILCASTASADTAHPFTVDITPTHELNIFSAVLSAGGTGTFLYQYEPEPLVNSASNCTSYGAWGMFAADNSNKIRQRTSQFFAAQLITQQWAQPVDAAHAIYPSSSSIFDMHGNQLVTSYAVLRPDATWSLLLINKDRFAPHNITIIFRDGAYKNHYFQGSVLEISSEKRSTRGTRTVQMDLPTQTVRQSPARKQAERAPCTRSLLLQ